MDQLHATHKALQAELQVADQAAARGKGFSRGGGGGGGLDSYPALANTPEWRGHYPAQGSPPDWRGSKALRGDVLEKLKSFQQVSKDLKSAEIKRVAAGSAEAKNTAVREALIRRFQSARTFVCSQARQLRAKAVIDYDDDSGDIDDGDAALDTVDQAKLLEQLEVNLKAAQEEYRPQSSCSTVELKEALLVQLDATRAAAQAELLAAEARSEKAAAATGLSSAETEAGALAAAAAAVTAAMRAEESGASVVSAAAASDLQKSACDDFGVGGGRGASVRCDGYRDSRDEYAEAGRGGGGGGAASAGEGDFGNGGAGGADGVAECATGGAGSGRKKRKRTSGAGRRCKHEGW